jgi:glucose-1-phosphate adenylyltransferase
MIDSSFRDHQRVGGSVRHWHRKLVYKKGKMMGNVCTLVLGGGRGSRLYPLTKFRAKPAVPLGGNYRLIDIPLSNCINCGFNQIYVLTQFLSASLHRHLRQTYRFDSFSGGFVELLAAQETMHKGSDWYQGTADAVRKNLEYIQDPRFRYVLILSGDQMYRMDYREMLATHVASGAEITLAGLPVSRSQVSTLGTVRVDDTGRVCGFVEKPQTAKEVAPVLMDPAWFRQHGVECNGRDCIANMGIYLFNRETLVEILTQTDFQDFGKQVFPRSVDRRHVQVHLFDGYWEDIGTIRAFYESNLSLTDEFPPFQFDLPEAPIFSRARFLPPSRIRGASVTDSLIADGCEIGRGAEITRSIIGPGTKVGERAVIRDSIVFGIDTRCGDGDRCSPHTWPAEIPVGIGEMSEIRGAIIDRNARIGRDVRVSNDRGIDHGEDRPDCMIRDGIPIVLRGAILPDGWSEEMLTALTQTQRRESYNWLTVGAGRS